MKAIIQKATQSPMYLFLVWLMITVTKAGQKL